MRRFSWGEMRRYWQAHGDRWADVDRTRDPEGLTNVCHPGAPLWLNRYYARFQRAVYRDLLTLVAPPSAGARALDVGCGAGRWCRVLADRGYRTTGIDLQPELLDRNRSAHPDVEFVHSSIQEFEPAERFDVLSSVTVIQHVPHDEQDRVIERLRALAGEGAHAVVLENLRDQGAHVFSNPIGGWSARFERGGFRLVALRRYDYSPMLRLLALVRRALVRREGHDRTPESLVASMAGGGGRAAAGRAAARAAVAVDSLIEPLLVRANAVLPTVHCGFLFRAV